MLLIIVEKVHRQFCDVYVIRYVCITQVMQFRAGPVRGQELLSCIAKFHVSRVFILLTACPIGTGFGFYNFFKSEQNNVPLTSQLKTSRWYRNKSKFQYFSTHWYRDQDSVFGTSENLLKKVYLAEVFESFSYAICVGPRVNR